MTLDEAIMSALDGEALLFLGAGFSKGAMNMAQREFPLGKTLCIRLIEDGKIDTSEDSEEDCADLGYITERYLENNTKQDLIKFLRSEFHCNTLADYHKIIAEINWKRIYTTNYDDVFERASGECSILRQSVSPEMSLMEIAERKNAIIHMNGSISELTEETLDSTFKLSSSSYFKRTITDNDWAICLHNDLMNAKCLIFIGYSMDYDLELTQIFASIEKIREKCIFVTWKPTKRQLNQMSRFGEVDSNGCEKFAEKIKQFKESYTPMERIYETYCLKEIKEEDCGAAVSVNDEDVTDLLFYGEIRMDKIFSSNRSKYLITRKCVNEIINDVTGIYTAVIIHSDLGNGKSVILRELEVKLISKGRVFFLNELNPYLQDDMDYICSLRGMKFVFVENYNRIIDYDEAKIFSKYQRDDIKFIFTVRTYLNENLYQHFLRVFSVSEEKVAMYDINMLTKSEETRMCELLDTYSLWGERSTWNHSRKMKYIQKQCHGEIKDLMLDLLNSENMQRKINKILDLLFENDDLKEITLLIFICKSIAIDLQLDDIVLLLNKQVKTALVLKNESIREFLDFDRNRIELKSPLVARYILQNNNFNADIERVLRKILPVLDEHRYVGHYKNMLRMVISYSNLRMVFNLKNKKKANDCMIGIYESSKNLNYHKENPFFWLQYAIARMEIKDYNSAKIYLDNAASYCQEKFGEDSWQIETNKARLLLERTMYEKDVMASFSNFEEAFSLLYNNRTPDLHYPLRQVSLFQPYYETFYKNFSDAEKNIFLFDCRKMEEKIENYLSKQKKNVGKGSWNSRGMVNIQKQLRKMRSEMVAIENLGHINEK